MSDEKLDVQFPVPMTATMHAQLKAAAEAATLEERRRVTAAELARRGIALVIGRPELVASRQ